MNNDKRTTEKGNRNCVDIHSKIVNISVSDDVDVIADIEFPDINDTEAIAGIVKEKSSVMLLIIGFVIDNKLCEVVIT